MKALIFLERRILRVDYDVHKGDRFEVLVPISKHGLTHWRAPFTGGFKCIIPAGTILEACSDNSPFSIGFSCIPVNREEFEKLYVPESDRTAQNYAGYSFGFRYSEIGKKIKKL